jgi:hypothetical protein
LLAHLSAAIMLADEIYGPLLTYDTAAHDLSLTKDHLKATKDFEIEERVG